MSLANENKNWAGNQSDSTMNSVVRPIAQPPCDLPSQKQFSEESEYIDVKLDRWGNEIPQDWPNHRATTGLGAFGGMQFADSDSVKSLSGVNVYGPEDANKGVEKVIVDVSRADRGNDS